VYIFFLLLHIHNIATTSNIIKIINKIIFIGVILELRLGLGPVKKFIFFILNIYYINIIEIYI
jgi:hypothetical protein